MKRPAKTRQEARIVIRAYWASMIRTMPRVNISAIGETKEAGLIAQVWEDECKRIAARLANGLMRKPRTPIE